MMVRKSTKPNQKKKKKQMLWEARSVEMAVIFVLIYTED